MVLPLCTNRVLQSCISQQFHDSLGLVWREQHGHGYIFCLYSDVKKQSNSHLPNFPKKNTKKTWKFETIFWSCSFCNHQPKPSTWLIFNKENRTFWQKLSAITFFVGLRLQKQFHCSLFISSICLIWVQQSWERNIIN